MTTFTHRYVNPQVDDGDPNVTGPDEWNDDHESDHAFVIIGAAPANLTGTRSLAVSGLLGLTDGGAGGAATIGLASVPASAITGGQALTRANDTNVTLTLGGTPGSALLAAVSLTLGWAGLLGLDRGGTHADLSATGGAGQYLKQVSSGADITVGTIPASDIASGAPLNKNDDTNVTVTLTGSPATALLASVNMALGWTGLLAVSRGGTGAATLASNGVLYGNGAGAVQALAVNSTATNKFLTQSSSAAPAWATIAAGDLPGSFSGFANPSASVGLSAVNGSATTAMRSDGAPALSQSIAPTWTALHQFAAAGITTTFTDRAQLINSTAATSGVAVQQSPSLRFTAHVWNTTVTAADNTFDVRETLVPTSAATPSARFSWHWSNNGGSFAEKMGLTDLGVLDLAVGFRVAGGATSGNVLRGNGTNFVDATLTAADIGSGAALTKVDDTNVTLALGGTPATALLKAVSLTLGWTGTLAVARGGIGVGTLASNGVLYGNGTSAVLALAVNSTATNKFLTQSSSGAPAWATIVAGDLPGSFSGFANPTASVGLAVVNGSATTAMRSDGAPALSQSIAPSWTGLHIFLQANIKTTFTDAIEVANTTASDSTNTVQQSASLRFIAHVWNTTATAADNSFDMRETLIPASGATPSAKFTWRWSNNGGAYAEKMSLSDLGVLDLATGYRIGAAAASGNYLRGNGTNFVSSAIQAGDLPGSFSGFANPSASLGLAAVNGSATTAMRSDAAPALSQAINPTWTATHNWTRSVTGVYWQTWASTAATAVTWGFANNAGPTMSIDEVGVAQRLVLYGSAAATSGAGISMVNWVRVGSGSAATNVTAGDFEAIRGFFTTRMTIGSTSVAAEAQDIYGNTRYRFSGVIGSGSAGRYISFTDSTPTEIARIESYDFDATSYGLRFHGYTGGSFGVMGYWSPVGLSVGTANALPATTSFQVVMSANRSTIQVGDNTANGYARIAMQSRYTGASGKGSWMFESIDTEFYLYSLTNSNYLIRVNELGYVGLGGAAPVANVGVVMPNFTYNFKFLSEGGTYTATFHRLIPCLDANGTVCYLRSWT